MIFVTLDIIAFFVQLIGGGMAGPGSDAETAKRGLNIYMTGIGVQEAFVVAFSLLIVKFVREKIETERRGNLGRGVGWRRLVYALCACLVFISVRIVFRLVEFSGGMGMDNKVPYNEKLFYAFEAVRMLLAIVVWNAVHPTDHSWGRVEIATELAWREVVQLSRTKGQESWEEAGR